MNSHSWLRALFATYHAHLLFCPEHQLMEVLKLASFVKTCLTPAANVISGWANRVGRPKALSKIGNKERHSHRQCFFNCLFAKRLHPCGGQKPSMVPDMSTGHAYRRPRAILMKASSPHPFVASQRARSLKQFRNSFLAQHEEYGFCPPQSNRKRRLRTYYEISWTRN